MHEKIEVEGRVLLDSKEISKSELADVLWNETKKMFNEKVKHYAVIQDQYLKIKGCRCEGCEKEMPTHRHRQYYIFRNGCVVEGDLLETKILQRYLASGNYGIRAVVEKSEKDQSLISKKDFGCYVPLALVVGERMEFELEYEGNGLTLTVDRVYNPDVVGMEYELVADNREEAKERVAMLEDFVENNFLPILDGLAHKHNFEYEFQPLTYVEMLFSRK